MTKFLKLTVVVLLMSVVTVGHADPITKQEAAEWERHVRHLMGWHESRDLREEALGRLRIAQKRLEEAPYSRSQRRDAGDALHTLGHMAEHEHLHDFAISLHLKAFENFGMSGLETRESWEDGREHAREHIFMDLYDEAVLLSRRGDLENAYRYFETAAYFAFDTGIARTLRGSDRFESRFLKLGFKLSETAKGSGRSKIQIGEHAAAVFGEIQCKVLFGNPLGL